MTIKNKLVIIKYTKKDGKTKMKEIKVLLYNGSKTTEAYKRHLFMVSGVFMFNNKKIYVPQQTENRTITDLKEMVTEYITKNSNNASINFVEVTSFEAFKRVWLEITGKKFN